MADQAHEKLKVLFQAHLDFAAEQFSDLVDSTVQQGVTDGTYRLPETASPSNVLSLTSDSLPPLSISGSGKDSNPDAQMHITADTILFGGRNNGMEVNSAQISAGLHVPKSLNIIGMGPSPTKRRIDVWAEKGLMLHGKLGIGTETPTADLEVKGTTQLETLKVDQLIRHVWVASANGPSENINTGRIASRKLAFTKSEQNTALLITYTDNLSAHGENASGRWEIRIDDDSDPANPIHQDLYPSEGSTAPIPSTIKGIAKGIDAGEHTISIWVGDISEGETSDRQTGSNNSTWTIEVEEIDIQS